MRVHPDPRMIYFSWLFISNWSVSSPSDFEGFGQKWILLNLLWSSWVSSEHWSIQVSYREGKDGKSVCQGWLLTNFIPSHHLKTYQSLHICKVTVWRPPKNEWEPLTCKGTELGLSMDWKQVRLTNTAHIHPKQEVATSCPITRKASSP